MASDDTTRPEKRRRAGQWADEKTGRRASTGWKAASATSGFWARRRAAKDALAQRDNHNRWATGAFAAGCGGAASVWAWGGRRRAGWQAWAQSRMDQVDPDPAGSGGGEPAEGGEPPGDDGAPPPPHIPEQTLDPNTGGPEPAPNNTRSTTMAGLPHSQIATDMLSAAGRYEPADAYTVVREARQWPDVSRDVAMSVRAYAQCLEGARFPLDQACLAKLQEYYTALSKTVALAEEIEPLLRKAHQVDLERQENPRGDEKKWNV